MDLSRTSALGNVDDLRLRTAVMAEVHPAVPLRTRDAIHRATLRSAGAGSLFSKDKRMDSAARRLNLPVVG